MLEYDFQVRSHAAYLVNTTGLSLHAALINAREDEKVMRLHFITPITLAATTDAVVHTPASGSMTRPAAPGRELSQADLISTIVDKAVKAVVAKIGNPNKNTGTEKTRGGRSGQRGKNRKADDDDDDDDAGAARKDAIAKVHLQAMKNKKCIRHNKKKCDVKGCNWAHDCCICGKKDCAGWKHLDALK